MELNVLNINGKETGRKVELPDSIFAIEPNDHAIYLDVKQYLANQRQGTHKAKERNEISGSTRKLKKQKGTGGARAGSIKNPQFRGGGRIFGPRPRNYDFKLNFKLKQLARKSALAYKALKGAIVVVEDFSLESPKTKDLVAIQKNLNLVNVKNLVVLKEQNNHIYLASRNLPKSQVMIVNDLNTYSIMNAGTLVLLESSVAELGNLLNA
jgi:large subunit ribosomal protein L4